MEGILACAFAWVIGGVGLWTSFKQLRNRAALDRWPITRGKVIERGTYQPYIPTAGPPAFRHSPLVKYVYDVGGKEFISDRIRPKRIQQPQHNTNNRSGGYPAPLQPRRPQRILSRSDTEDTSLWSDGCFKLCDFVWSSAAVNEVSQDSADDRCLLARALII